MSERRNAVSAVFGLILIGLGVIFLAGQFIHIDFFLNLWPLAVIGVGGLFFLGMVAGGPSAGGLAIPGSIITVIGLTLTVQNTFGHWEGWSYEWTLILVSVGIGLIIRGYWSKIEDSRRAGWKLVRLGAILFLVFGAFFELGLGFGGRSLAERVIWPLALILVGIYLFASRIIQPHQEGPSLPSQENQSSQPFIQ